MQPVENSSNNSNQEIIETEHIQNYICSYSLTNENWNNFQNFYTNDGQNAVILIDSTNFINSILDSWEMNRQN